jgi:hypothetical protein
MLLRGGAGGDCGDSAWTGDCVPGYDCVQVDSTRSTCQPHRAPTPGVDPGIDPPTYDADTPYADASEGMDSDAVSDAGRE